MVSRQTVERRQPFEYVRMSYSRGLQDVRDACEGLSVVSDNTAITREMHAAWKRCRQEFHWVTCDT